MKRKTTTILLSFLLGGIGVHRFYLGQTLKGFLYLLFCWTYIPLLISFIDIIMFLFMDNDKFNNLYNQEIVKQQLEEERLAEEKRLEYEKRIIELYGDIIANKIFNREIWLDMNPEHLLLIKGKPSKIEKSVSKKKSKEVYIYGNKNSGDVFTFIDGMLTEYKDR